MVSALIPVGMAIVSIFTAVGVATIASQAKPLNFNFFEMIILMGLAVGIDYSLFIISRFREERAAGKAHDEKDFSLASLTGQAFNRGDVTIVAGVAYCSGIMEE